MSEAGTVAKVGIVTVLVDTEAAPSADIIRTLVEIVLVMLNNTYRLELQWELLRWAS